MTDRQSARGPGLPLNTAVTDEIFEELSQLAGDRVVHVTLWPDRLSDALAEPGAGGGSPTEFDRAVDSARPVISSSSQPVTLQAEFDLDVYLEGGVYFELYGTLLFASLDSLPLQGEAHVRSLLRSQVQGGIWLDEVAVDEEDQLVLVLGRKRRPAVYLVVGGWVLDEWEELPDDGGGEEPL
jgi:hypothetical protein